MTDPSVLEDFWRACCDGNLKEFSRTFSPSMLTAPDSEGNTALHKASSKGKAEIVRLLLRYHAHRKIKNKRGLTAEDLATDDEVKKQFQLAVRPESESDYFEGTSSDMEWVDTYKNAYRIAHENHEHMRRWLLKVPLKKLLEEVETGYIDKMTFYTDTCKKEIQGYIKKAIESNNPKELIKAYTSSGTRFYTKLNYHLAEIGSDFRFLSTQNLFNSDYMDNEAPKDLGQHIFVAILINHPVFRPYYHAGTSYRGMGVSPYELEQYKEGSIVLTRSLLSTTIDEYTATLFVQTQEKGKRPLLCVYIVKNPRSSLDLNTLSKIPDENEILIFPFTVFQITKREDIFINVNSPNERVLQVTLEEYS